MIQNINVGVNSSNEIDLQRLVDTLNNQGFFKGAEFSLSYLSPYNYMKDDNNHEKEEVYVYCGDTSKLHEATNIPWEEAVNSENQLKLKVRKNKKSLVENLLEEQKAKAEKDK